MTKYANIINSENGLCEVALGTNIDFYKSIGMQELDVTQSQIDNQWYLTDKLPSDYDSELFQKMKDDKIKVASKQVYTTIENSSVEYKSCVFETKKENRDNLRDTDELMTTDSVVWQDKNDMQTVLTKKEIQAIRACILSNINNLWNTQYLSYKKQIETCSTIDEINVIDINYNFPITVESILTQTSAS